MSATKNLGASELRSFGASLLHLVQWDPQHPKQAARQQVLHREDTLRVLRPRRRVLPLRRLVKVRRRRLLHLRTRALRKAKVSGRDFDFILATDSLSSATNLDASDRLYAANLRRIGVVDPNPFFAPPTSDPHQAAPSYRIGNSTNSRPSELSSAESTSLPPPNFFPASDIGSNPALRILQSRQQLQDEAERELDQIGRRGFEGRKFVDIGSIRDAISLRDSGMRASDIEKRLGMRTGSIAKLGTRGVVENVV